MRSKRKALALALCAVLLVVTSVLGTIAYLTDSESVLNTFTVGNIEIDIHEAVVDENGQKTNGRTTDPTEEGKFEGNKYHLLPGLTYDKDPTVTILKGSEKSYVRMIVTVENYDELKAAIPSTDENKSYYYNGDGTKFLLQTLCMDGNDATAKCTWDPTVWNCVGIKPSTDGKSCEYEFRYVGTKATEGVLPVVTDEEGLTLEPLFEKITVPGHLTNTDIAHLAKVTIKVEAHAIQADGFDDADDAWNNF